MGEPALQKALKMEKVFLTKSQERMLYENRQKAIQTYDATMEGRWEDGKSFGLREGEIKGKELGLVEGELIGLDKGKLIGVLEEKRTLARVMLQKGTSKEFVAEVTGLSLKELQEL